MAAERWLGFVLSIIALAIGCGTQAEVPAIAGSAGATTAGDGASGESGSDAARGGAAGAQGETSCPKLPPAPEAGQVLDGDLTVSSVADAESALPIAEITGSLVIAPSFPGVLYLPNLRRVGADVQLQGNAVAGRPESEWAAITELRLPNLERIDGELYLYLTGALVETDFRSLQTVGDRVYYMRNLALRRIGLDSIMAGSVSIQASPQAAACEIDAICEQVGAASCGAEYSDPDCDCAYHCGRLEPRCQQ
jgi:hypothetical protein